MYQFVLYYSNISINPPVGNNWGGGFGLLLDVDVQGVIISRTRHNPPVGKARGCLVANITMTDYHRAVQS